MIKLYFVTNNMGKFNEAKEILNSYGVSLERIDTEKIEIQSTSLEDIARYSAIHVYKQVRKPIIVEDSGLFIDALNGFPGPYSSYVYKTIGLKGILKLLQGENNRKAVFEAVVALALREDMVLTFKGVVEGYIALEIRGSKGFGYDPIFVPKEGEGKTFAEMDIHEKNMYSHRGKAFRSLGMWINMNIDKLKYIVL
ncbi:MAG: XTP/dITP diphosphatase [Ignisphaera sp.]|uniref:dITP/XTP pyrophosphatase n=1 Tax=Ignisphaera aggregans TaxID=334771 RepID=A0A7J3MZY7_9CREN